MAAIPSPQATQPALAFPARPMWGALLLAAALLPLRWWVIDHPVPVHGDEVEFVAALGFPAEYPVHHPGYPLWIAAGTVLRAAGLGPYAALQAWSVGASVLGPALLYLWLRCLTPGALAWCVALAYGVCPLVWFTSVTALNYASAAAVGLAVVFCCWKSLAGGRRGWMIAGAGLFALGVLLRLDLAAWLGPLVGWAAWRGRGRGGLVARGKTSILGDRLERIAVPSPSAAGSGAGRYFRHGLLAAMGIAGVGLGAGMLVPAWLYSRAGGAGPDLSHTVDVLLATSFFRLGWVDGLLRNGAKLGMNLGWDLGVGAVAMVAWSAPAWRRIRQLPDVGRTLLLCTIPLLLFLLLVHMSEAGHVILLLPAAYCWVALGLASAFRPRVAVVLALCIAAASCVQFAAYPWSADAKGVKRLVDAKVAYLSAAGLRQIDRRGRIHAPGDFWPTAAHHRR